VLDGLRAIAAAVCFVAAAAQADEVRVGRYRLLVPDGTTGTGIELSTAAVAGNGDRSLPTQGKLVRLTSSSGRTDALLLVRTIDSGGSRFQWSDVCRDVKPDENTFVHNPFHDLRAECLIVGGPYDLDRSARALFPHVGTVMDRAEWSLKVDGYFIQAFFAISSGAMLDVTALVPMPFAGQPIAAGQPENRSKVPGEVVAWGLSLADQVKSGVLSISGRWQVPPIIRPHDGAIKVVFQ
jgi:hypothetical protein